MKNQTKYVGNRNSGLKPLIQRIRSPEEDNGTITSILYYDEEIGTRIKKTEKYPKSKKNDGTEQEDGLITTAYGISTETVEQVETGEETEDTYYKMCEIVQEKEYKISLKELPNMMEILRQCSNGAKTWKLTCLTKTGKQSKIKI